MATGPQARSVAVVLALVCLVQVAAAHKCIHEQVVKEQGPAVRTVHEYNEHHHDQTVSEEERNSRRLATTWEDMRIHVIYDKIDAGLDAAKLQMIQDKIIPDAVGFWSKALQVDRVDGPLRFDRTCTAAYTAPPFNCQEFSATTRCGWDGNPDNPLIPDSLFNEQLLCATDPSTCTTLPAGAGVEADYVLFVSIHSSSSCSGGTLAYAYHCQQDQFDRPSMGATNICPTSVDTDPDKYLDQYSTAVHELGHALGFSSAVFPYFRDPAGNPRTPRDANGDIVPGQTQTFTCNSASHSEVVPAPTTIDFFDERGFDSCVMGDSQSCVHKMVTPKVQEITRAFFDCPTMQGAELENQDTSGCGIVGSHWEARTFVDTVMAAFAPHHPHLHPATLAVFEDSGWYMPNYLMADPVQQGVTWGFQQGCDVAMGACLDGGVSPGTPKHFCEDPLGADGGRGCSLDRKAQALCSADTYPPLPAWYQHFADPTLGGWTEVMDYCPYWNPIDTKDCFDSHHAPATNYLGETYVENSLCLESTLNQAIGGFIASSPEAGCYPVECVSTSLLRVTVAVDGGSPLTLDCTSGTQTHSPPGFNGGTITCLDPARFCAPPQLVQSDGSLCPASSASCSADAECCFTCQTGHCCGRDVGTDCTSCGGELSSKNCLACAPTSYLEGGACFPKKAAGESCSSPGECTSGTCTGGSCVGGGTPCSNDDDCSSPTPHCDGSSNSCVGCSADGDCPTDSPKCQTSSGYCFECLIDGDCGVGDKCSAGNVCYTPDQACTDDNDCGEPQPVCDTAASPSVCTGCAADADCPTGETCDMPSGRCMECYSDSDCGTGERCDAGGCVPNSCTAHSDCSSPTPHCDSGTCVGCSADGDCPSDKPKCQASSGYCYECLGAGDCGAGETCSATFVCETSTVTCASDDDCSSPTPYCDGSSNSCVGCSADGDCPTDSPKCQTSSGYCFECLIDGDCGAGDKCSAGNVCYTPDQACTDDNDCGEPQPVCDTSGGSGVCTGCSDNSDCPTGEECDLPSGMCFDPSCSSNADCTDPSMPNCGPDGNCYQCTQDHHCGFNKECASTGVCVDQPACEAAPVLFIFDDGVNGKKLATTDCTTYTCGTKMTASGVDYYIVSDFNENGGLENCRPPP